MPEVSRDGLFAWNLLNLMALEANGLDVEASRLVDKIGAGLARQPRRRSAQIGAIELPKSERGRSEYDLRRLDAINARLLRGYKAKGGKSAEELREADLRERQRLEQEFSTQAQEAHRKAALAETEALAASRGEAVGTERSGVRRILDRDPLLSLARCGHLTPEQLDTGHDVRDLYDLRRVDMASPEHTGMPGGAHDHERFVGNRFKRAQASNAIGEIERAVATICTKEPASLAMLRAVCDRGLSVASQGKGRAFERNAAALAMALEVAADVLRNGLIATLNAALTKREPLRHIEA